jgi:hypothetical protein
MHQAATDVDEVKRSSTPIRTALAVDAQISYRWPVAREHSKVALFARSVNES